MKWSNLLPLGPRFCTADKKIYTNTNITTTANSRLIEIKGIFSQAVSACLSWQVYGRFIIDFSGNRVRSALNSFGNPICNSLFV